MAKDDKEQEQEQKPKKGKLKIIIILIIILLLLGGGAGVFWWFNLRTPTDAMPNVNQGGTAQNMQTSQNDQNIQQEQNNQESNVNTDNNAGNNNNPDANLPQTSMNIVNIPNLTVNLADKEPIRYLKLGMDVELTTPQAAKNLQGQIAKVRDAIIITLSSKYYNELSTTAGKLKIKNEISSRLNQIIGAPRVVQIYFTQFVVQ